MYDELTLPNAVETIGSYAFARGYQLVKISIPDSVKSIGTHAFMRGEANDHIDPEITVHIYYNKGVICDNLLDGQDMHHIIVADTVVFKDHNGSVLTTQTYHYGDAVSAPEAPTRESDVIGSYTFKSWDKTVVNCAGDATYTATYEINYTDYTVVFKDDDGTVLSTNTYHYGDEVTAPTAPTKADDAEYTYTFAGWDKEIVACAGDSTYTATYSSTKIEDIQTSTPNTDSNTDTNASVDSSMTENNTDTDKKTGCAGAIGGASVGVITLISVGGALLLKKKKRK